MSIFLKLLRNRFRRTEHQTGDYVPWELDDKFSAYELVKAVGYKTPQYARCASAAEALQKGLGFGKRFLVKQPNRHSGKGIYLLENLGGGTYIDLLTLKLINGEPTADGQEPPYWLAEECVEGDALNHAIPFDYKVYCFSGQPAVILQINRNVSPPAVAVFDGTFVPLVHGVDYEFDPSRWQPGAHVLPYCAVELLEMAGELARITNTLFVSVDAYCTPAGPVFGEFTFAPGAPDTGMIRFSSRILAELDRAAEKVEIAPLSGFDIDTSSFYSDIAALQPAFAANVRQQFRHIASAAVAGDKRYARLLTSTPPETPMQRHFQTCVRQIGLLNGDNEQAFYLWRAIVSSAGYLNGPAKASEYRMRALEFHSAQAPANMWHASRAAEIRLADGDPDAVTELQRLAEEGYQHAANVLAASLSKPRSS